MRSENTQIPTVDSLRRVGIVETGLNDLADAIAHNIFDDAARVACSPRQRLSQMQSLISGYFRRHWRGVRIDDRLYIYKYRPARS